MYDLKNPAIYFIKIAWQPSAPPIIMGESITYRLRLGLLALSFFGYLVKAV